MRLKVNSSDLISDILTGDTFMPVAVQNRQKSAKFSQRQKATVTVPPSPKSHSPLFLCGTAVLSAS